MKNENIMKVENLKSTDNTFIIRWNITKICNYYCDFCVQGDKSKHLNDSKGESIDIRRQICDKIMYFIENKLNNKYSQVRIFLIGGEITILKDFLEILEKLLNSNFNGDITIYITTNLSVDISVLEKLKKLISSKKNSKYSRKVSVTASYYKEFTTEKEFMKKIKLLHCENSIKLYLLSKKNKFKNNKDLISKNIYKILLNMQNNMSNITVNIGYPLITDEDYKEYLRFKRRNFLKANSINYIIIRNYHKSISEQLKLKLNNKNKKRIKVTEKNGTVHYFTDTYSIGFKIDKNYFNPYGMICDSGVYNLTISNKGILSRCPSCREKTMIGNILDDNIEFINEKIICPSARCVCNYYKTIERDDKNNE